MADVTDWGEPMTEFIARMKRLAVESTAWPVPSWGSRAMAGLYAAQAIAESERKRRAGLLKPIVARETQ